MVISDTNIWQANELEYRSNLKCTLSILKLCEILSWDLRISSKVAQSLESGGQNCKTKDSWEVCFDGTAVLYHIQFITNSTTIKKSETITLHVLSSNQFLKSHAQEIPEKNLFSVNLSRARTKFERCKPAQEVWSIEVPRKKWPAPFSPFVEIWQLWKSVEVDWPGLEIKLAGCQTLWVNYQCSTINWSTAFHLKCYCNGLVS